MFGDSIEFHVRDANTTVFNVTQHNEWMKCIRQEVKDAVYDIIDDMADGHIESWGEQYTGKSKDTVECELTMNYDMRSDIDSVEDYLKQKLKDDDFTLNKEEREYIEEQFVEAVLEAF